MEANDRIEEHFLKQVKEVAAWFEGIKFFRGNHQYLYNVGMKGISSDNEERKIKFIVTFTPDNKWHNPLAVMSGIHAKDFVQLLINAINQIPKKYLINKPPGEIANRMLNSFLLHPVLKSDIPKEYDDLFTQYLIDLFSNTSNIRTNSAKKKGFFCTHPILGRVHITGTIAILNQGIKGDKNNFLNQ